MGHEFVMTSSGREVMDLSGHLVPDLAGWWRGISRAVRVLAEACGFGGFVFRTLEFHFDVLDPRHIDREAVVSDAEFLASAKVGRDLRTVDDVLAWQASDIRTRSADVFAVNDCDPLPLAGKRSRPRWSNLSRRRG